MARVNRLSLGVGIGVVTKERPIQTPSPARPSAIKRKPTKSGARASSHGMRSQNIWKMMMNVT